MACGSCGKRKLRTVTQPRGTSSNNTQFSGLTIAPAKSWLRFPPVIKPPGGWSITGLPASTPEEAADRLAGKLLATNQFVNMQDVYKRLNDIYCSRVGSPCGKK